MTDTDVKPVEPNEAPTSLIARSSKLLVGGGIAASVVAHLTLGGVVLLASPRLLATVPQNAMMVDIVTPKEFAEASKSPQAMPESGVSPNKLASEPQSKTEQKTGQKPEQVASVPPAAPPPQRPPPSAQLRPQQPVEQKTDERAEAARAPDKEPEQELPDPARIVELLHLPVQVGSVGSEAPPSENTAKLSSDEIAAFKGHVKTCWTRPAGAPDAKKLKAVVRVALGPDGQLTGKPVLLAASASLYGPALVESVMRALAQCQPYSVLPAEKYQEWKLLDLNFSQDDISDVSSSPKDGRAGPKG
jgi:hypothetical protein